MSWEALIWVWEESPATGSDRLVHEQIAYRCKKGENVTFPVPHEWIAHRTNLSQRQVSRSITELIRLELVTRFDGGYGNTASSYVLALPTGLLAKTMTLGSQNDVEAQETQIQRLGSQSVNPPEMGSQSVNPPDSGSQSVTPRVANLSYGVANLSYGVANLSPLKRRSKKEVENCRYLTNDENVAQIRATRGR